MKIYYKSGDITSYTLGEFLSMKIVQTNVDFYRYLLDQANSFNKLMKIGLATSYLKPNQKYYTEKQQKLIHSWFRHSFMMDMMSDLRFIFAYSTYNDFMSVNELEKTIFYSASNTELNLYKLGKLRNGLSVFVSRDVFITDAIHEIEEINYYQYTGNLKIFSVSVPYNADAYEIYVE